MQAIVMYPAKHVVLASRERVVLYNMTRLSCSCLKVHEKKEIMNNFYRQGEVIAVSGENADIQLALHGFCSGKHKCALATFGDDLPPERNRVQAKNGIGAHVGEKVVIEVFSPGFFRALFFVLLLPLVALISGCFFGIQFAVWMGVTHKTDLYGGIFAILFFFFSLCISRFVDRKVHPDYVVSRRMDEKQDCGACSMIK